MKVEIVKFSNGKYGIRRRASWFNKLFGVRYLYRDFKPILIKWRKADDSHFPDCQLNTLVEVEAKIYDVLVVEVFKELIIKP